MQTSEQIEAEKKQNAILEEEKLANEQTANS